MIDLNAFLVLLREPALRLHCGSDRRQSWKTLGGHIDQFVDSDEVPIVLGERPVHRLGVGPKEVNAHRAQRLLDCLCCCVLALGTSCLRR